MEIRNTPPHGVKMKMRNLRAKVKLLLPENICSHYKDRNLRVEKFQTKRIKSNETRKSGCKRHLASGNSRKDPWYYQTFEPIPTFGEFHRLSKEELQEIEYDKQYFLGQDLIEGFTQYRAQGEHPSRQHTSPMIFKSQRTEVNLLTSPVVSPQQLLSLHLNKENKRQSAAKHRFEDLEDTRRIKGIQKEKIIEARILKAQTKRQDKNQLENQSKLQKSQIRATKFLRVGSLQNLNSERTEIIRMTSELKRICAFQRNQQGH